MSRFLRLCAFLSVVFFSTNVFAAGYVCSPLQKYTSCKPGYYMTYNGNPDSSPKFGNKCTICPAGSYCPGGIKPATACVAGTYAEGTGNSACTLCSAGQTTSGAGTTSKASCVSCANNNGYVNAWVNPTWNSSTNTVTNLCKVSNCKSGSSYSSLNGRGYSGSCTACADGRYMSSNAHTYTSCTACTSVTGWTAHTTVEGATAGRHCYLTQTPANCSSGVLKRTAVSQSSTTIIYSDPQVVEALAAKSGAYVDGNVCSNCPAGSFCPGGTVEPTECALGSYSTVGAATCTACSAGQTTNGTGQTSCEVDCENKNDYVNGWMNPSWNSSTNTVTNLCTVSTCKAGSSQSTLNGRGYSRSCNACADGKYMSSNNHRYTSCTACTPETGWTAKTGGTGATTGQSCYLAQTPANCSGGLVKRPAVSLSGTTIVYLAESQLDTNNPLTASPSYYVNGTACTICTAGNYCPGGTTSPQACPTNWTSYAGISSQDDCHSTVNLDPTTGGTVTVDSNGTMQIYAKYNGTFYLDADFAKPVTTSQNPITTPTANGWAFDGYAGTTSDCKSGTRYINSNGYKGSSLWSKNLKMVACWNAADMTCVAGKYYDGTSKACTQCEAGYYCAGGGFTNNGTTQGRTVCANGYYSNAGASACSACANLGSTASTNGTNYQTNIRYTNSGTTADDHAGTASCKITCPAGSLVVTRNALCSSISSSYYTGAVGKHGSTSNAATNDYYKLGWYVGENTWSYGDALEMRLNNGGDYVIKFCEDLPVTTPTYAQAAPTNTNYPGFRANWTDTSLDAHSGKSACKATVPGGAMMVGVQTGSSTFVINRTLQSCVAGSYCPGGTFGYPETVTTTTRLGPVSCSAELGTGYTSGSGASAVTGCYLPISAGNVRDGTSGTTTKECVAGTYKAAHNAYYGTEYECDACTGRTQFSAKKAGSCSTVSTGYYTTGCNSSGNNCTAQSQCTSGTYCESGVQKNCSALTPAVAVTGGTYSSAAGSSAKTACKYTAPSKSDTECSSITANTVSYDGTAWGTNYYTALAKAGAHVSATGNTSAPACESCAKGTYQGTNGSAAASCTSADAGYYVANTGASSQTPCSAGTYTSKTGQSSCATITDGCWGVEGATSACPNNCNTLAHSITISGAYSSVTPRSANTSCRFVAATKTDTECSSITANTVSYSGTAWGTNYYTALAKAGAHVSATGKTAAPACESCAKGTYQGTNGSAAASCTLADAGYYVANTGASGQTPCSAGTYTSTTGQSSCATITDGCWGVEGATSACPNNCNTLAHSITISGTYSSVTPRSANTSCRFVAVTKYNDRCSSITANKVSYDGTAWGTNYYTVLAMNGAHVSATGKTAAPACESCAKGTYQGTYDSTATSCTPADAGYYVDHVSAGSQTPCPAGRYTSTTGQSSCAIITDGCWGGEAATSACPNNCNTLAHSITISGTYSSEMPRWSNTSCRFVADTKTEPGCRLITAKTVSYDGTAWGTNYYTASANEGYYVVNNNTASASCSTCTENNYCPGGTTAPQACPSLYSTSATGAKSNAHCYLTTTATKYVAEVGKGEVTCKAGSACAGGTKVYYAAGFGVTTGGIAECGAGKYSAEGAASCSKISAGCYGSSATSACPAECAAGTYATEGSASCSACTGRTKFSAKKAGSCSTVSTGYYTTGCNSSGNNCTAQSQCTSGTYCEGGVQKNCSALTPAVAVTGGTYSSEVGSSAKTACKYTAPSKSDTECSSITANKVSYSGTAWGTNYYTVSANEGSYVVNNNTASASCSTCTENKYCPGGATAPQSCPSPYSTSATGAKSNAYCYLTTTATKYVAEVGKGEVTCKAGYACAGNTKVYYAAGVGATTGGIAECGAVNKYSAAGASSCSTVSTGYYTTGGTTTTRTAQSQCTSGTYCEGGVQKNCSALTPAVAVTGGEYSSVAGASANTACKYTAPSKSDTECSSITANKVSYDGSAWGTNYYTALAKAGAHVSATGNTSAPACESCAKGTYQGTNGSAAASCTQADAGYYVANAGASSQTACLAGTYTSTTGQSSCTDAVAGTYTTGCKDTTNNKACTGTSVCAANTYSDAKASACVACATNYGNSGAAASSHAGVDSCKVSCAAGYYVPTAGEGCQICTAGKYCEAVSAVAQTAITSETGNVSAGYYSTGGGTSATPTAVSNGCLAGQSCGLIAGGRWGAAGAVSAQGSGSVRPGFYSSAGATSEKPNKNGDGCVGSNSKCGIIAPGYYGSWGATVETGSGPVDPGYYSAGGATRAKAINGDGYCYSGDCGQVDAGYWNNGGGTSKTPSGTGDGCIAGKSCGVIGAGYYGAVGATSSVGSGTVSGGYFSTGGGKSATPSATDCVAGNTCGKINAGYWSVAGAKKAAPAEKTDCIGMGGDYEYCGVIAGGYYATCGASYKYPATVGVECVSGCSCGAIEAGRYTTGCGIDKQGSVCSDEYEGGIVPAGYYSTDGSSPSLLAGGYYSTGGATTATPSASDCIAKEDGSANECGSVDAGYYSTGGGTSKTPSAAGNGCVSGEGCGKVDAGYWNNGCGRNKTGSVCSSSYAGGVIAAGFFGNAGATSSTGVDKVWPGHYSTGGATKQRPTSSDCVGRKADGTPNECGLVAAGYYTSHGGKTATPADGSIENCVNKDCGPIAPGYYSTGGATRWQPYEVGNHCFGTSCGKVAAEYYSTGGGTSATGTCLDGYDCGQCDANYRANTETGKTSASACQISCAKGMAVLEEKAACAVVTGSNYKTGTALVNYGSVSPKAADITSNWSAGTVYACPNGYSITGTSADNHDVRSDCSISCKKGTQVATANETCTTPKTTTWYSAAHSVSAGSTSATNVKNCNSGYKTADSATESDHDDVSDCKISCAAGYYVPNAGAGCKACSAGKYCAAVNAVAQTATTSETGNVSAGYYSTGGGTSATPTAAGNGCLAEFTCGKVQAGCWGDVGAGSVCPEQCPVGYRDGSAGYSDMSQCLMNVAGGKFVQTPNESSASGTCAAGYAKAAHTVKYGETSSCDACTGATYAEGEGNTKCESCPTATNTSDQGVVKSYSYWIPGGIHTKRSNCSAYFKTETLEHGSVNVYCYVDTGADTYGVNGTSTLGCYVLKSGLVCDGGYYNEMFNKDNTLSQHSAKTLEAAWDSACEAVGEKYWSGANSLTRTACASGLTTCGSGLCANEATDCGRKLHFGDKVVHLRSEQRTNPTLKVKMDDDTMFYGNLGAVVSNSLRVKKGTTDYSVVNDNQ